MDITPTCCHHVPLDRSSYLIIHPVSSKRSILSSRRRGLQPQTPFFLQVAFISAAAANLRCECPISSEQLTYCIKSNPRGYDLSRFDMSQYYVRAHGHAVDQLSTAGPQFPPGCGLAILSTILMRSQEGIAQFEVRERKRNRFRSLRQRLSNIKADCLAFFSHI